MIKNAVSLISTWTRNLCVFISKSTVYILYVLQCAISIWKTNCSVEYHEQIWSEFSIL